MPFKIKFWILKIIPQESSLYGLYIGADSMNTKRS